MGGSMSLTNPFLLKLAEKFGLSSLLAAANNTFGNQFDNFLKNHEP